MKQQSQSDPSETKGKRTGPLKRLLLLDVIGDRESAPIFIWAGVALLIGVLVYHWLEGWSLLDALYFCVVTLSTIGYGDLTPTTPLAKLFTVVYVINGIGILLALIDRIRALRTKEVLGDRIPEEDR